MEENQERKLEGSAGSLLFSGGIPSSSNCHQLSSGLFDLCEGEKSSLGFMELLGAQDSVCSPFDWPPFLAAEVSNPVKESLDVRVNRPATPNTPSISSASTEALNDEQAEQTKTPDQEEEDEQEEEELKAKKRLKLKKANQKRQREPRFAFMTKSEVDHLEDGYRWRKYGQKAVKNSPFPRSYYRCTSSSCNVKKRVERSFTNPTIVVTTYEGQHTHPSPIVSRSTPVDASPSTAAPPPGRTANFLVPMYTYQRESHFNGFPSENFHGLDHHHIGFPHGIRRFCSPGSGLLADHGLLQDVIPSHMLKQE